VRRQNLTIRSINESKIKKIVRESSEKIKISKPLITLRKHLLKRHNSDLLNYKFMIINSKTFIPNLNPEEKIKKEESVSMKGNVQGSEKFSQKDSNSKLTLNTTDLYEGNIPLVMLSN